MKIAVGSKNPVKINAVKNAFNKFFNEFELVSLSSPSNVSNMPMSLKETIEGARNRAIYSIKSEDADFGVGLEGGCEEIDGKFFLSGIVVIKDKNGKEGIGKSSAVSLPESFIKEIKKGKELGEIIDEITNDKDSKQKGGAVSFLTDNKLQREDEFTDAVTFAIVPFIKKDLYS
jgi:inosine/xanthosine triphosphatase